MSPVIQYPSGAPCWPGLRSSSPDVSAEFYTRFFGWQSGPPPPNRYAMFSLGVSRVAGVGPLLNDSQTPGWYTHLAADNVDQIVETARRARAGVLVPRLMVPGDGSRSLPTRPALRCGSGSRRASTGSGDRRARRHVLERPRRAGYRGCQERLPRALRRDDRDPLLQRLQLVRRGSSTERLSVAWSTLIASAHGSFPSTGLSPSGSTFCTRPRSRPCDWAAGLARPQPRCRLAGRRSLRPATALVLRSSRCRISPDTRGRRR